ncbi:MAG: M48 family metalloprotease, partial [Alphaproteobacteria bacterium]|nr:M48 family metalloprotease [Alphaproteobacteria bacterium]
EHEAVRIHLVNDGSLNAFVAGGQRIFIFTGLLMAAESPDQVIGVLAHETGHITGGHLARFRDGLQGASTISIISLLLGAAAIAAGAGDAGAAILSSGGQFAQRNFLSYSRTQESAADQAGLQYLTEAGISAEGLLNFFEYLGDQEALLTANKDPYVRSHPLTQQRIARLREQAQASPAWGKPPDPAHVEMLKRTQAKLVGFLDAPRQVLRKYPKEDTSAYARYARSIMHHREGFTDEAIDGINSLLLENPQDPFYWELKGQILFESGRTDEAITPYQHAVQWAPNEPLIRVSLAQALLSQEDPKLAEQAIDHLKYANHRQPDNGFAWHQLALAYNLTGDQARAALASAERYAIAGSAREAVTQARYAARNLEPETPDWYRARDLYFVAKNAIERAFRERGRKPPNLPEDPSEDPTPDDTEQGNSPDDAQNS